ncbi:hypothetical protein DAMA08_028890 [Martiniozyma asiatica (nom. inval.)]|nr:hypothetical protein DAMA08_028890 [Martiniozyma asiatica]
MDKIDRRLSLPATLFLDHETPKNRRHTLLPSKSIIKKGNASGRRVSFANEVTVHNFRKFSRKRKRSSLSGPVKTFKKNDNTPISLPDNEAERYNNGPDAENDNSTQTMEMSIELANQIQEQQEFSIQNITDVEEIVDQEEDDDGEKIDEVRDLFEEFDNDDEESQMELTEPIQKDSDKKRIIETAEDESDGEMELTEAITVPIVARIENEEVDMEFTEAVSIPIAGAKNSIKDDKFRVIEDEKSITDTGNKKDGNYSDYDDEKLNAHDIQNNKGSPDLASIHKTPTVSDSLHGNIHNPVNYEFEDESKMEVTEPVQKIHENITLSQSNLAISESNNIQIFTNTRISPKHKVKNVTTHVASELNSCSNGLSTVTEISEPRSDITVTQNTDSTNENIMTDNFSTPLRTRRLPNSTPHPKDKFVINAINFDETNINTSSDFEASALGVEIVPLAEVSLFGNDNLESADLEDESYINVSIDSFLKDIGVQFFDNIGPSEREVSEVLNFELYDQNIIFPNNDSPTNSKKQTLMDYIEASNNILYFHYLTHLITQYKSSIRSISTMVSNFSHDVEESNLATMRQYYKQVMDIQMDFRTNYQSIANFTRKQAQCENVSFENGLLEQLIASYENDQMKLSEELQRAVEWRKTVLLERQHMIEEKLELAKGADLLQGLKGEWKGLDLGEWKDSNQKVNELRSSNHKLEESVADLNDKVEELESVYENKLKEQKSLEEEIEQLSNKLFELRSPVNDELEKLERKFNDMQNNSNITLHSIESLEFTVDDCFIIKLPSLDIKWLNIDHFSPFCPLLDEFQMFIKSKYIGFHPHQILVGINDHWKKWKEAWVKLMNVYLEDSYKISFNPLKLTNGKITYQGELSELINGEDLIISKE